MAEAAGVEPESKISLLGKISRKLKLKYKFSTFYLA